MYAAVRCAIESGARVLYGGGGAYELKRRLGFTKLPDNYMMVAASTQWLRWLTRGAIRLLELQKENVDPQSAPNDQD
jgi:hypothetical protein